MNIEKTRPEEDQPCQPTFEEVLRFIEEELSSYERDEPRPLNFHENTQRQ